MERKYKLDYQMIAKRIKAARRAAQLTQAELAEKINISTNAVAKLETNLMSVSLQTLINIANVLDIDMNYLLSDNIDINGNDENTDIFLESLIANLSMRDKAFIIHTINGLKAYNAEIEK
ncbi:MAG: helix-turn-helix transcriptional regulator [Oscillibacter sp.]|nr:helix-turn-helix transcriptional regulator [Oscillibacter sp.]MBD5155543.1 helix-turn-helix transcriptional regulator [Oscillibacter sp.]